ncbi:hypothetical protein NC653_025916 [Populus alba x Populus x berolinensis]|uniref:Uncharacterized protein n=1 Tax=Populus alba x Populus x berolinensis TaxID=444605 RepID=A0AAD6Q8A9_9ROSI|nr:hypothetical protein NC653_025916 [Populus alba x Populus x berolinensis]
MEDISEVASQWLRFCSGDRKKGLGVWPRDPCGAPEGSSRWQPPWPLPRIQRLLCSSAPPFLSASISTPSLPKPPLLPLILNTRWLSGGSAGGEKVKHEVHSRSTAKLQELCFENGGRVRFSRKSLKRHLVATIDKFIVHVARTDDGQKLSVRPLQIVPLLTGSTVDG